MGNAEVSKIREVKGVASQSRGLVEDLQSIAPGVQLTTRKRPADAFSRLLAVTAVNLVLWQRRHVPFSTSSNFPDVG
jgi:hypothetical protein